jgi:hypothetical protein
LAKNAVHGTDKNRYFEYLENGETKKVSLEEAAAAIAAAEALKDLGSAANMAQEALNSIKPPEDAGYTKEDVSNFIANGNFDTLSQDSFNKITEGLAVNGEGSYVQTNMDSRGVFTSSKKSIRDFYGGDANFEKMAAARAGVTDLDLITVGSEKYD